MEKPRLYIHIGYHKTGTSILQKFLFLNRQILFDNGVLYPSTGLSGDGHAPLALSLNNIHHKYISIITKYSKTQNPSDPYTLRADQSAANLYTNLHEEIIKSKHSTIVISSECFVEWLDPELVKCRFNLGLLDIKIIVYLRRQDNWLQSVYNQLCKDPYFRFTGNIYELPQIEQLDYYKCIESWAQVFGKRNIIVRPYEKRQLTHGLFADFLRIIGLSLTPDYYIPNTLTEGNPSLDNELLAFIRVCNEIPMTQEEHMKLLKALESLSTTNKTENTFLDHYLLSPKERSELVAKYEAGNRLIAKNYLDRSDGQLFYDPISPSEFIETLDNSPLEKSLIKLFAKLLVRFEDDTQKEYIEKNNIREDLTLLKGMLRQEFSLLRNQLNNQFEKQCAKHNVRTWIVVRSLKNFLRKVNLACRNRDV
jgi:hypothetical protein